MVSGQVIVLPMTVAAAASAPRINMTAAELAAVKIEALKHIVSPRYLSSLPAGGVEGRCAVTGQLLTTKGTQPTTLVLSDVDGNRALGLTSTAALASLALPAGSQTNSYTLVFAVNTSAADRASASPVNYLSGYSGADVYNSATLRFYGSAAAAPRTSRFISVGPSSTGTETFFDHAAAGWAVVIVAYDNDTRVLSIAVDQVETFNTVLKGATAAQDANAYFEIGYHLSGIGLRTSKVGDLFSFDKALVSTTFGREQLSELVVALKAQYGITA